MSARKSQPKPWPMRWIVLAIVLTVVPYTYLTLHYRKTGPAFNPYEDLSHRATVLRLLHEGWQRIPVTSRRPADGINPVERPAHGATIQSGLPGLPPDLAQALVEKPELAATITNVTAPAEVSVSSDYPVYFTCTLADQKHQILDVQLYVKGETAMLIPNFEKVSGQLLVRTNETSVQLDVPTQSLKAGHYRMTLVGAGASKAWDVVVK
ncbi:MAG TPA: hypothetical protein VKC60_08275 [Opitutaceae bacterium]|nr:hypothetical protein [Opitutaceae bacterium]